jgi:hypothetical protein
MAPTALGAHLAELMLHARPDTAQINGDHLVEALGRLIGWVASEADDAGIVEGHVQPAVGRDGALDHLGDLHLIRHVAGDADGLLAVRGQPLGRTAERVLIDVGEHHGGTRLGESLHARQPDAGACTSDQGNLAAEVINRIHRLVPWFLRIVI